jgi:hypothetical protein
MNALKLWEKGRTGQVMVERTVSARKQFERIAQFCRQSDPLCELVLMSEPDSLVLKFSVRSGIKVLYESHALDVSELTTMSDHELWELLEHLSNRRIQRPAVESLSVLHKPFAS